MRSRVERRKQGVGRQPSVVCPSSSPRFFAFTLLELLVVIAILGILASLLLPVLSKAKDRVRNISCMNNLKQLELCAHLYTADNNDYLVPNNSVSTLTSMSLSAQLTAKGLSWCLDGVNGMSAVTETTPTNIVNGLLYQYNASVAIYHCPADTSRQQDYSGKLLPQLRLRSYNMSQSVNGYPDYIPPGAPWWFMNYWTNLPSWKKYTQIRSPIPGRLFVFIDENEDTIFDSQFGNVGDPPLPYSAPNQWWDMPSNRHNRGANLSFADGHVEHWRWKLPMICYDYPQWVDSDHMTDYQRVIHAMKQSTDH
jgi:prepilin-type processing-associated H-X9-DG protein/prepilin-type N-terminal cleavage/methylation domain-containing protein